MLRSFVGAAVIAAALLPAAASAQPNRTNSMQTRADSIVVRYADPAGPGLVVAVVRGGAVIYRKAGGLASLEQRTPLTTSSILDVGSVSKQFTAFGIALLESQGQLSLDDDIRKYLPEVPDLGQRITIRNLLQHTSGLREIYNTMSIGGWQAGDGMMQEQALRLIAAQPALQFAPGTEHVYNNTGYMLLADIIERVTKTQFHIWMREHIFQPLGMQHTVIMHELGQVIPGSGDSYARVGTSGYVRSFDNSTIQGAGGIYSTVDDLARWLNHWSRPVVGTRALLERMQQRTVLRNGDTLSYALGITIDSERGLRRIQHGGSSAGYRTMLVRYPDLDAGVIVQSNFAGLNSARVASELADVFFGDRMQPRVAAAPAAAAARPTSANGSGTAWKPDAAALAAYAGRYYSSEVEAVYVLRVTGDTLTLSHRRIGDVRLQPRRVDLFAGLGELQFTRDANGRITGFTVSNGRTRGVRFDVMR